MPARRASSTEPPTASVVGARPAHRHRVAQRDLAGAVGDAVGLDELAAQRGASSRPRALRARERDRLRERADVGPRLAVTDAVAHPAGEAAAIRRAVRRLARGRQDHVRDALDAVDVDDLRVRADHQRRLLAKSLSSCSISCTSLRSPSWLASPGSGSLVGWWAKTSTRLTAASPAASSSASRSSGSCAKSEPRSVPRVRVEQHEAHALVVERPVGLAEDGLPGVEVVGAVGLVVAGHVEARDGVRGGRAGRAVLDQVAAAGLERRLGQRDVRRRSRCRRCRR